MRGISWLSEELLPSQGGLCFMESVNNNNNNNNIPFSVTSQFRYGISKRPLYNPIIVII